MSKPELTIQNSAKVDGAVAAAREALEQWANTSLEYRIEKLNRYGEELKAHRPHLAEIISQEVGKPLWESMLEVDAMVGKVGISIEAQRRFRTEEQRPAQDVKAMMRFKPHGVAAVLGPFN